jgi:hypothetical protein
VTSRRRPASLAEIARQQAIPLDRSDAKTLALIDEHGWMVMHVSDPSGHAPGCSFSIGLTYRFQQPEYDPPTVGHCGAPGCSQSQRSRKVDR